MNKGEGKVGEILAFSDVILESPTKKKKLHFLKNYKQKYEILSQILFTKYENGI